MSMRFVEQLPNETQDDPAIQQALDALNTSTQSGSSKKQKQTKSAPATSKSANLTLRYWLNSPAHFYPAFIAVTMASLIVESRGTAEAIQGFSTFASLALPIAWVICAYRGQETAFKVVTYLVLCYLIQPVFTLVILGK